MEGPGKNRLLRARRSIDLARFSWPERNELRKTNHAQCIITSNCQRCCQFSLLNLCSRESLCDIRRDCYHHFLIFVSERDLGCNAKRVCQAKRSLMSPFAGTKHLFWTKRQKSLQHIFNSYLFCLRKYIRSC